MAPIFEYRHRVVPEEIDDHGHVNNVNHVRWMQHVAVAHSSVSGWPPERYQREQMGWVARRHTIEYLQPAYLDDEIVIRTGIADFRRITSTRKYRMRRLSDGVLIAVAETQWAFINLETGQPMRIPAELAACFAVVSEDALDERTSEFPR